MAKKGEKAEPTTRLMAKFDRWTLSADRHQWILMPDGDHSKNTYWTDFGKMFTYILERKVKSKEHKTLEELGEAIREARAMVDGYFVGIFGSDMCGAAPSPETAFDGLSGSATGG